MICKQIEGSHHSLCLHPYGLKLAVRCNLTEETERSRGGKRRREGQMETETRSNVKLNVAGQFPEMEWESHGTSLEHGSRN